MSQEEVLDRVASDEDDGTTLLALAVTTLATATSAAAAVGTAIAVATTATFSKGRDTVGERGERVGQQLALEHTEALWPAELGSLQPGVALRGHSEGDLKALGGTQRSLRGHSEVTQKTLRAR